MSYVYKTIKSGEISREQNVVNYTQNLTTSSLGVSSTQYISGSTNNNYWQSIHILFYTSGSPILTHRNSYGKKLDRYDSPGINFRYRNIYNPQHVNKFHGYPNGTIISIPQKYFGDKIKEGSFELTDISYKDNDGNAIKIKDDKYGNLYSSNAYHSQSTTPLSSSDNYIGNIFYEHGLVVLTETGSWSGSINYSDITSKDGYSLNFESTHTIYTNEYSIVIKPNEFNHSMNYTLRCFPSGSGYALPHDSGSFMSNQYLCAEFTGSEFQPYITTVHLYHRNNLLSPVVSARLPKPIRVSDKITQIIKLKLDL